MSNGDPIQPAHSEPVRVLLVEDNAVDALLLQHMLTHTPGMAFRIDLADCLAAGVARLGQGTFDIVILDLSLPDSTGFDTFARMHAAAEGSPIVLLTGLDDEALAVRAVQAGAQDYLAKGQVDRLSLVRVIRYSIERHRAHAALVEAYDLLRSLIDHIPDQVYMKDKACRFVSVNPATLRVLGAASPGDVAGRTDFDFFPRELADQFYAEEQALLSGGQPHIDREATIVDAAGNTQWVLTTKVPLQDRQGNVTGLLGINRDITERKRIEEATRRLNEELERRVIERTADLSKALAHLEEHNRARAEFVSNTSHELKTPLTSMKLEIENLLEGVAGPVPERVVEYLEMLNADCQRMSKTVEDVLDLGRLETGTMRLNRRKLPFDMLVRRAATALRTEAQAQNIELILALNGGAGFVECDVFKMERVIINIVGNAIKFTPEWGTVDVALQRDPAEPASTRLTVTDSGIGIAPEHVERVGEKYYRVGEHISGTGLGLSISKEIVALHGGSLRIQSPPPGKPRGTEVTIRLPTVTPPTILVATGDNAMRALIEQQVASRGYRSVACTHGEEAMESVRRELPDVMLLDLFMPIMDGEEVILQMRSNESYRRTPIVVVTGSVLVDRGKHEILEGFGIPLMQKPWSEDELFDRIEGALIGRSAGRNAILPKEKG